MRFGLAIPIFEDLNSRDPLAETYRLYQLAEDVGFELAFVPHHHFTPEYLTSAPFVLLGAIAARTHTLRLGTGIFLLPLHHPVHVAESVALLDRLSGGRAILGVGVGYREYEYAGFGLHTRDRGARATEALKIIRQAWTEPAVHFEGKHFSVPGVAVTPRPVQKPHPPIWVGAVAAKAQKRAAELGDGWISDLMMPLDAEVRLADRYRSMCAAAGRSPTVVLLRQAAIAERREDLEERWLPDSLATQLAYWRAGARGRDDDGLFARLDAGQPVDLPSFVAGRVIAGDPDDCITELHRWRSAVTPDVTVLTIAGSSPGEVAASIERFGRHVLPAFA